MTVKIIPLILLALLLPELFFARLVAMSSAGLSCFRQKHRLQLGLSLAC
ncbi:hypothetical protein [Nitratireductor pacificus]|nr:hypothetical protein [Nitratireductor pacificus]